MNRTQNNLLDVRSLHVYYGSSHVLQGVNIVMKGGIHAVLGRNGMGKTTLCKAIMGLVPIGAGSIRFDGNEISNLSAYQIANKGIGYTPQGRKLWKSLSVDDHLRLCAVLQSPWNIDRIYETFPRLAERRHNRSTQLSGGEQQMLTIARALLPGPRLLVMDEPTEGLAPVVVDHVVDLLQKIASSGEVSVLLVEQNLSVATELAEDISIMVNGQVSIILPAAQLAADRPLQERLLGVGSNLEDDGPILPQVSNKEILDQHITDLSNEDLPLSKSGYVPPPRWSAPKVSSTSVPIIAAPPSMPSLAGTVLVVGTFDTKAHELNFIRDRLRVQNIPVKTVDLSTYGAPSSADIPPHQVAAYHPGGMSAVMTGDRGTAVAAMAEAFEVFTNQNDNIFGIISAAGSGGTSLVTPAMRSLPIGIPKVMISTIASGDVSRYVGPSDIMMMYSVTDVQGIHQISAKILANGADALAGAIRYSRSNPLQIDTYKPVLGLTMFGVTTPAVQAILARLENQYECLVFHATGTGGQSMEKLVDSGLIIGALDVSTTEVCDMMMGGVMPATEDRFGAFIRTQIPYVGSVGALDMVNWGAPETIPDRYKDRIFYEHNPQVTLMRTTADESNRIGSWIAERLNLMHGPVRFLLPLEGVSALDSVGQPFDDSIARQALFDSIRSTFEPSTNRKLIEVKSHINDPLFASAALAAFAEISK